MRLRSSVAEHLCAEAIRGKVEYSKLDLSRCIGIPTRLTEELSEEAGIFAGDGSLNIYNRNHRIVIAGNRVEDAQYYKETVLPLLLRVYNASPKLVFWSEGTIGVYLTSRAIGSFKNRVLGFPLGPKKHIQVPTMIRKGNKKIRAAFIRGLFDTDGTLYFEGKYGKKPYYPRIQITNTSKELVEQVFEMLTSMGFTPFVNIKNKRKGWRTAYDICICGKTATHKWFEDIGSSHEKTRLKYALWKKLGWCPASKYALLKKYASAR